MRALTAVKISGCGLCEWWGSTHSMVSFQRKVKSSLFSCFARQVHCYATSALVRQEIRTIWSFCQKLPSSKTNKHKIQGKWKHFVVLCPGKEKTKASQVLTVFFHYKERSGLEGMGNGGRGGKTLASSLIKELAQILFPLLKVDFQRQSFGFSILLPSSWRSH